MELIEGSSHPALFLASVMLHCTICPHSILPVRVNVLFHRCKYKCSPAATRHHHQMIMKKSHAQMSSSKFQMTDLCSNIYGSQESVTWEYHSGVVRFLWWLRSLHHPCCPIADFIFSASCAKIQGGDYTCKHKGSSEILVSSTWYVRRWISSSFLFSLSKLLLICAHLKMAWATSWCTTAPLLQHCSLGFVGTLMWCDVKRSIRLTLTT